MSCVPTALAMLTPLPYCIAILFLSLWSFIPIPPLSHSTAIAVAIFCSSTCPCRQATNRANPLIPFDSSKWPVLASKSGNGGTDKRRARSVPGERHCVVRNGSVGATLTICVLLETLCLPRLLQLQVSVLHLWPVSRRPVIYQRTSRSHRSVV